MTLRQSSIDWILPSNHRMPRILRLKWLSSNDAPDGALMELALLSNDLRTRGARPFVLRHPQCAAGRHGEWGCRPKGKAPLRSADWPNLVCDEHAWPTACGIPCRIRARNMRARPVTAPTDVNGLHRDGYFDDWVLGLRAPPDQARPGVSPLRFAKASVPNLLAAALDAPSFRWRPKHRRWPFASKKAEQAHRRESELRRLLYWMPQAPPQ